MMENKLKTLKDLRGQFGGKVSIDELKAEAVERAKQCIKNIKDNHYKVFNKGRLWEIMDFNDLSEEDLK